jgi:hypothetical protein
MRPECDRGNVRGNNDQISSCTCESKTTKPADLRRGILLAIRFDASTTNQRVPGSSPGAT